MKEGSDNGDLDIDDDARTYNFFFDIDDDARTYGHLLSFTPVCGGSLWQIAV